MKGRTGIYLVLIILGFLSVAESGSGNVGYDDLFRDPIKYQDPPDLQKYVIILEPARIFFSDEVKITKITTIWQRAAQVRFQLYTLEDEPTPEAIHFRLKAQTEPLDSSSSGQVVFESGLDMLVASYGDVLAIYFEGANPIPYRVPQYCDNSNNKRFYWGASFFDPPSLRVKRLFLPAPMHGSHMCREYLVEIETHPTNEVPDSLTFGVIPDRPATLDLGAGLLVITNQEEKLQRGVHVIGWKAMFIIPKAKVHFVVLYPADALSFYIRYKSEAFYVFKQRMLEIRLGPSRRQLVPTGSVLGLYFEGLNPVPYELENCGNNKRSLQVPINRTGGDPKIIFSPRNINPCRKYAFQLIYKEADVEMPRTTAGPTECYSLTATSSDETAQSNKVGAPGVTKKIRPVECWVISAPEGMVPRLRIIENTLKAETICNMGTSNRVELRDGRKSTGELRYRICDGESGYIVDSCKEKELYILVKAGDVSKTSGIKFSYTAVPEAQKTCNLVKVEESVSAAGPVHPNIVHILLITSMIIKQLQQS